jgi:hypothetical protein
MPELQVTVRGSKFSELLLHFGLPFFNLVLAKVLHVKRLSCKQMFTCHIRCMYCKTVETNEINKMQINFSTIKFDYITHYTVYFYRLENYPMLYFSFWLNLNIISSILFNTISAAKNMDLTRITPISNAKVS